MKMGAYPGFIHATTRSMQCRCKSDVSTDFTLNVDVRMAENAVLSNVGHDKNQVLEEGQTKAERPEFPASPD